MKRDQPFVRKVIYLVAMAALLVPINMISSPATNTRPGGTLSQLRAEHRLSQANLGDIDPAGASMSLATLGMRGVAANLLWERAIHYKKTENWDSFKATLNQITKLQPNFIAVWKFQAWNISYNISVEFDDYRHRYHWVKKGVDFLIEGTRFNRNEPRLLADLGWFFAHKFGRSDEYVQFRRLFREDEDFHAVHFDNPTAPVERRDVDGPDGRPDNWLLSRHWYVVAQNVVDTKAAPLKGTSPLIFHSEPPKTLINFADAIEEEGYLDEKGQTAWKKAYEAWIDYGNRSIPTSFGYEIRLNDLEPLRERLDEIGSEFNELAEGIHDQILAEKKNQLTDEEREVADIPAHELSEDQREMSYEIESKITVSEEEVAERVGAEKRELARRLAREMVSTGAIADTIRRYREIVNFDYWRARCEVEQLDDMVAGRRHVFEAERLFDEDADLEGARAEYERGWDLWATIFDRFPMLLDDIQGEDLYDSVLKYEKLLGQLDQEFPPPGFKLMPLLEAQGREVAPQPGGNLEIDQLTDESESDGAEEVDSDGDRSSDSESEEATDAESEAENAEAAAEESDEAEMPADESSVEETAAEETAAEETGPAESTEPESATDEPAPEADVEEDPAEESADEEEASAEVPSDEPAPEADSEEESGEESAEK